MDKSVKELSNNCRLQSHIENLMHNFNELVSNGARFTLNDLSTVNEKLVASHR
ncbi:MAG: hypothetical protein WBN20_09965 [Eudoraea sp.]|uniref:hypothetical protein n=1 Tax=Eudoraea sp. TaxID=1979955 RepID=UPI003C75FB84